MARELTFLEMQFILDSEKEFPDYYDYTPREFVGFLKKDTSSAFAGYRLAVEKYPRAIYAVGTMVRFKSDPPDALAQVVHEVAADPSGTTYGVGGSWWHEHDNLEFVSDPTEESILAASSIMGDAREGDGEEGDDEDEDEEREWL